MISGRPFCWLPGPLTLKSEAIGVGNKPDTVPSVRGTDGTSRNKQRLDGISFTLKITADGLDDVFLPLTVYRLILSEQRGLTSHVSRLAGLYHLEDATNVLTNNPTGPDLVNGTEHVRPEVTAVLRALSPAGNGKGLAGESPGNKCGGFSSCFFKKCLLCHCGNVPEFWYLRPVLFQNFHREIRPFALAYGGKPCGFRRKVDPADPGKQAEMC